MLNISLRETSEIMFGSEQTFESDDPQLLDTSIIRGSPGHDVENGQVKLCISKYLIHIIIYLYVFKNTYVDSDENTKKS